MSKRVKIEEPNLDSIAHGGAIKSLLKLLHGSLQKSQLHDDNSYLHETLGLYDAVNDVNDDDMNDIFKALSLPAVLHLTPEQHQSDRFYHFLYLVLLFHYECNIVHNADVLSLEEAFKDIDTTAFVPPLHVSKWVDTFKGTVFASTVDSWAVRGTKLQGEAFKFCTELATHPASLPTYWDLLLIANALGQEKLVNVMLAYIAEHIHWANRSPAAGCAVYNNHDGSVSVSNSQTIYKQNILSGEWEKSAGAGGDEETKS